MLRSALHGLPTPSMSSNAVIFGPPQSNFLQSEVKELQIWIVYPWSGRGITEMCAALCAGWGRTRSVSTNT